MLITVRRHRKRKSVSKLKKIVAGKEMFILFILFDSSFSNIMGNVVNRGVGIGRQNQVKILIFLPLNKKKIRIISA